MGGSPSEGKSVSGCVRMGWGEGMRSVCLCILCTNEREDRTSLDPF